MRIISTVFLITACFVLQASQMNGASSASSKLTAIGAINLAQTNGRFNAKNIFLKMPSKMSGELRVYRNINQMESIRGEFMLDNLSHQKQYIQYRVVFKDKKGVVAQ